MKAFVPNVLEGLWCGSPFFSPPPTLATRLSCRSDCSMLCISKNDLHFMASLLTSEFESGCGHPKWDRKQVRAESWLFPSYLTMVPHQHTPFKNVLGARRKGSINSVKPTEDSHQLYMVAPFSSLSWFHVLFNPSILLSRSEAAFWAKALYTTCSAPSSRQTLLNTGAFSC